MNFRIILKEYKWRLSLTFLLILLEAMMLILFPLFIGKAIDGSIEQDYKGAIQLAILGLSLLIIGMGRRVVDSRFYAKIYERISLEAVKGLKNKDTSLKSARIQMAEELVEFFENALPELINNLIGLFGVALILASLNSKIFIGSLLLLILILMVYWTSSRKTLQHNRKANNELEAQVEILNTKDTTQLKIHLRELMKWNIKLSDIEAINYSISWLFALGFLIASILMAISDGLVQYGALFALIMYVFQYIENVVSLPLYYQNWLRLHEIIQRFKMENGEIDKKPIFNT